MPLVAAKCTQCGANLQVNSENECSICSHCGTPFITEKAITNYNTTVNNVYNVKNETIVTGNKEVHFHNDEINKLFLIEDGELTRYRGRKSNVTVPEGVIGIGQDILPENLASLDKITLPSTLKYLESYALNHCHHVVFNENSEVEEIKGGALDYLVNVVENFPLTLKKWNGFISNSGLRDLIVTCKYSKEDFIRTYGEDKMFYEIRQKDIGTVRVKATFVFDFEKFVEKDGFTFAVGKSSATICSCNKNIEGSVLKLPSFIEGKPVTQCSAFMLWNIGHHRGYGRELEELYLPEKLEEILGMSQTFAKKVIVPSSVKRIGSFGVNVPVCGEVIFENGYSEVEEIDDRGLLGYSRGDVYAPNLRVNNCKNVERTVLFKAESITPAEAKARHDKYEAEKYDLTIVDEANLHPYISLQRKSGVIEDIVFMGVNIKTVTVKVHPSEEWFVRTLAEKKPIPKGVKSCTIKTAIFAPWKLICK